MFRFNAYAIHEYCAGNTIYESLFHDDDSEVEEPDFHHLEAFEEIDLSEAGYDQPEEMSDLWKAAIGDSDFTFKSDLKENN